MRGEFQPVDYVFYFSGKSLNLMKKGNRKITDKVEKIQKTQRLGQNKIACSLSNFL